MLLSVFIVGCRGSAHNGRKVPMSKNERATDAVLPYGPVP